MQQNQEQLQLISNQSIQRPIKTIGEKREQTTTEVLNKMFPEQQRQDKNISQAKELLGDLSKELSTDQLNNLIADVSVLVEYWLDDYEREILKGQTLLEFLNQKGSL